MLNRVHLGRSEEALSAFPNTRPKDCPVRDTGYVAIKIDTTKISCRERLDDMPLFVARHPNSARLSTPQIYGNEISSGQDSEANANGFPKCGVLKAWYTSKLSTFVTPAHGSFKVLGGFQAFAEAIELVKPISFMKDGGIFVDGVDGVAKYVF